MVGVKERTWVLFLQIVSILLILICLKAEARYWVPSHQDNGNGNSEPHPQDDSRQANLKTIKDAFMRRNRYTPYIERKLTPDIEKKLTALDDGKLLKLARIASILPKIEGKTFRELVNDPDPKKIDLLHQLWVKFEPKEARKEDSDNEKKNIDFENRALAHLAFQAHSAGSGISRWQLASIFDSYYESRRGIKLTEELSTLKLDLGRPATQADKAALLRYLMDDYVMWDVYAEAFQKVSRSETELQGKAEQAGLPAEIRRHRQWAEQSTQRGLTMMLQEKVWRRTFPREYLVARFRELETESERLGRRKVQLLRDASSDPTGFSSQLVDEIDKTMEAYQSEKSSLAQLLYGQQIAEARIDHVDETHRLIREDGQRHRIETGRLLSFNPRLDWRLLTDKEIEELIKTLSYYELAVVMDHMRAEQKNLLRSINEREKSRSDTSAALSTLQDLKKKIPEDKKKEFDRKEFDRKEFDQIDELIKQYEALSKGFRGTTEDNRELEKRIKALLNGRFAKALEEKRRDLLDRRITAATATKREDILSMTRAALIDKNPKDLPVLRDKLLYAPHLMELKRHFNHTRNEDGLKALKGLSDGVLAEEWGKWDIGLRDIPRAEDLDGLIAWVMRTHQKEASKETARSPIQQPLPLQATSTTSPVQKNPSQSESELRNKVAGYINKALISDPRNLLAALNEGLSFDPSTELSQLIELRDDLLKKFLLLKNGTDLPFHELLWGRPPPASYKMPSDEEKKAILLSALSNAIRSIDWAFATRKPELLESPLAGLLMPPPSETGDRDWDKRYEALIPEFDEALRGASHKEKRFLGELEQWANKHVGTGLPLAAQLSVLRLSSEHKDLLKRYVMNYYPETPKGADGSYLKGKELAEGKKLLSWRLILNVTPEHLLALAGKNLGESNPSFSGSERQKIRPFASPDWISSFLVAPNPTPWYGAAYQLDFDDMDRVRTEAFKKLESLVEKSDGTETKFFDRKKAERLATLLAVIDNRGWITPESVSSYQEGIALNEKYDPHTIYQGIKAQQDRISNFTKLLDDPRLQPGWQHEIRDNLKHLHQYRQHLWEKRFGMPINGQVLHIGNGAFHTDLLRRLKTNIDSMRSPKAKQAALLEWEKVIAYPTPQAIERLSSALDTDYYSERKQLELQKMAGDTETTLIGLLQQDSSGDEERKRVEAMLNAITTTRAILYTAPTIEATHVDASDQEKRRLIISALNEKSEDGVTRLQKVRTEVESEFRRKAALDYLKKHQSDSSAMEKARKILGPDRDRELGSVASDLQFEDHTRENLFRFLRARDLHKGGIETEQAVLSKIQLEGEREWLKITGGTNKELADVQALQIQAKRLHQELSMHQSRLEESIQSLEAQKKLAVKRFSDAIPKQLLKGLNEELVTAENELQRIKSQMAQVEMQSASYEALRESKMDRLKRKGDRELEALRKHLDGRSLDVEKVKQNLSGLVDGYLAAHRKTVPTFENDRDAYVRNGNLLTNEILPAFQRSMERAKRAAEALISHGNGKPDLRRPDNKRFYDEFIEEWTSGRLGFKLTSEEATAHFDELVSDALSERKRKEAEQNPFHERLEKEYGVFFDGREYYFNDSPLWKIQENGKWEDFKKDLQSTAKWNSLGISAWDQLEEQIESVARSMEFAPEFQVNNHTAAQIQTRQVKDPDGKQRTERKYVFHDLEYEQRKAQGLATYLTERLESVRLKIRSFEAACSNILTTTKDALISVATLSKTDNVRAEKGRIFHEILGDFKNIAKRVEELSKLGQIIVEPNEQKAAETLALEHHLTILYTITPEFEKTLEKCTKEVNAQAWWMFKQGLLLAPIPTPSKVVTTPVQLGRIARAFYRAWQIGKSALPLAKTAVTGAKTGYALSAGNALISQVRSNDAIYDHKKEWIDSGKWERYLKEGKEIPSGVRELLDPTNDGIPDFQQPGSYAYAIFDWQGFNKSADRMGFTFAAMGLGGHFLGSGMRFAGNALNYAKTGDRMAHWFASPTAMFIGSMAGDLIWEDVSLDVSAARALDMSLIAAPYDDFLAARLSAYMPPPLRAVTAFAVAYGANALGSGLLGYQAYYKTPGGYVDENGVFHTGYQSVSAKQINTPWDSAKDSVVDSALMDTFGSYKAAKGAFVKDIRDDLLRQSITMREAEQRYDNKVYRGLFGEPKKSLIDSALQEMEAVNVQKLMQNTENNVEAINILNRFAKLANTNPESFRRSFQDYMAGTDLKLDRTMDRWKLRGRPYVQMSQVIQVVAQMAKQNGGGTP